MAKWPRWTQMEPDLATTRSPEAPWIGQTVRLGTPLEVFLISLRGIGLGEARFLSAWCDVVIGENPPKKKSCQRNVIWYIGETHHDHYGEYSAKCHVSHTSPKKTDGSTAKASLSRWYRMIFLPSHRKLKPQTS